MNGLFCYLSNTYSYITPASLDMETGHVIYTAKERTNWSDSSSKGIFKIIQEDEHTLCPECHEYILKTVIGERKDLSYGEYTVCSNPDCDYNS